MIHNSLSIKLKRDPHEYLIHVGTGLLGSAGEFAAASLDPVAKRVMVVSNEKVSGLYGKKVSASLKKAGFAVDTFLMGDGERFKSLSTAEKLLKALSEAKISRTDGVIALGGGVVGDLAGFAAAVHLRGVPFLQIPTTLLAMIDSSVGGKTGVNTSYGKNLVGAFHQPAGVLADVDVLATLDAREVVAGCCEAVKHGVLSGRTLFKKTSGFFEKIPPTNLASALKRVSVGGELAALVAAQADFKRKIVLGDELEDPARTDSGSRKTLNLGHTFAHALEKATDYKKFKHGEAVGHGLVFAGELSAAMGLLGGRDLDSIRDAVTDLGSLPSLKGVAKADVERAFAFDKKMVSGTLQMVLLEGIGKPRIVNASEIPLKILKGVLGNMWQA